jgi:hypothetical protein
VREARQRLDLPRTVHRSHLRGLRDGNDARLHVMLVADAVNRGLHPARRQLPVGRRDGNQLAARPGLGGPALVHLDVRCVRANHRVMRLRQRLEAEHVRGRAVEHREDRRAGSEMFPEAERRGAGEGIVAVADHVAAVDGRNRVKHLGMYARVVVAREAAAGSHGGTL